ncbi:hypothetical protein DsansV1_C29g0211821 [Dioscorea sansibarensis]
MFDGYNFFIYGKSSLISRSGASLCFSCQHWFFHFFKFLETVI